MNTPVPDPFVHDGKMLLKSLAVSIELCIFALEND